MKTVHLAAYVAIAVLVLAALYVGITGAFPAVGGVGGDTEDVDLSGEVESGLGTVEELPDFIGDNSELGEGLDEVEVF